MKPNVLSVAVEVIQRASRERPADRVLRGMLKLGRRMSPRDAKEICEAVFAYYRWYGWLDVTQPLTKQIQNAGTLAERFAVSPQDFADEELVRKVVPEWVHRELLMRAGFARALQRTPKVWLRARPGHGAEVATALGDCRPFRGGVFQDTLEYRGTKDLLRTPEFHSGIFELQDLNSQVVGLVCAPKPGETWWDACAGEGGKLLHLSALMQNKGLIWGSDRAAWRLAILKRRAARAGVFNYRSVQWDGGSYPPMKTKFDGILVDAPCSGIGTWHRNPHARWTTTPEDVKELAEVQLGLLKAAATALKPGGKLVYSVCTMALPETLGVVNRLGKDCPQLEELAVQNPVEPSAAQSQELWLRVERHGGNGMYIAAWARG